MVSSLIIIIFIMLKCKQHYLKNTTNFSKNVVSGRQPLVFCKHAYLISLVCYWTRIFNVWRNLPDGILQQSACLLAPETTAFELTCIPLDFVASSCQCLKHYSLGETTGPLSLLEIFLLASGNVSDAWLRALGRLPMFLEFLCLTEIKNIKMLIYEIVSKRDFIARMKRIRFPVETVGNVTQFTFQPLACCLQAI